MAKRKATVEDVTDHDDQHDLHTGSVFLLFGEIDTESVRSAAHWILDKNLDDEGSYSILNLFICSTGGDLDAAFALIDVMKTSRIPIRTVGLGCIASSGLLIFMAGDKGQRVLTPNTSILSHRFSSGSEGKYHELIAAQKEFDLAHGRMLRHYRQCTKLTKEDIETYLLPTQDVYLSADEAFKLGLCDVVKDVKKS